MYQLLLHHLTSILRVEDFKESLDRLLKEHESSDYHLPPLKREPSSFENWVESVRNRFEDWKLPQAGEMDLAWIWKIALVVVFALVLFMIVRTIMNRDDDRDFFNSEATSPGATGRDLQKTIKNELEEALSNKNYALAMRLRWKIFLSDRALAATCTPQEYLRQKRAKTKWNLWQVYFQMFGGGASQADYQNWNQSLQQGSPDAKD